MLALLPASALADETTQIIIKRDPGLSAAERADIRADAGVRYVESLSLPRTEVVTAKAGDVSDAVRDLNADSDVVYAQPARARRAAGADPILPHLWAFDNTRQSVQDFGQGTLDADMDVIEAWSASTGAGQTVAVVDTGVDRTHPDLAGQVFGGWDFVDDDPDPSDPEGHGTHVAGTIAAARDNDEGVAGVAPDSILVPLRALSPTATDIETGEAFDWAGDHGVRIVNASLAGDLPSDFEREAMAGHPETLYIVAAGNEGDDVDSGSSAYPCAYSLANVICVGASDPNDAPAEFFNDGTKVGASNYGATSVDLFAPGLGIVSTGADDWYDVNSGTSMASPHVAGSAALVAARNPSLSAAAIKAAVLNRGDSKPGLAGKSVTGRRVNANGAATSVAANPTAAPRVITDIDGDGVADAFDNCLTHANTSQVDGNGDDVGDACDDTDGDTVVDAIDNCLAVPNTDQADDDQNGTGDACADDRDGDAVLDDVDNCPAVPNVDQADGTADGIGDACEDRDGDLVIDPSDNCVDVPNTDQANQNGDSDGDRCDDDRDGDTKSNVEDNCPTVANADQDDGNANGVGDECDDRDGDELVDASDNCVASANAAQVDLNGDGEGDACDPDIDGDGANNGPDNCDTTANASQADADRDGLGDACDSTPRGLDTDGDGKRFADDSCPSVYGTLPNGCPAPKPPPPAPPKPPAAPVDTDRDGRANVSDACPTEPALTANGCPLAQVAALSAKAKKRGRKRSARITVTATRVATMRVTVERKKGRKWVRVSRRTISGTSGTITLSRLKRGSHRVRVSISSSAGAGTSVSKTFRVR